MLFSKYAALASLPLWLVLLYRDTGPLLALKLERLGDRNLFFYRKYLYLRDWFTFNWRTQ